MFYNSNELSFHSPHLKHGA